MSKQKLAEGFGQILVKVAQEAGESAVDPDNPEHCILACLGCAALIAEKHGYSEDAFFSLALTAFDCANPKPAEDEHPF
jgi:hypothetical protein